VNFDDGCFAARAILWFRLKPQGECDEAVSEILDWQRPFVKDYCTPGCMRQPQLPCIEQPRLARHGSRLKFETLRSGFMNACQLTPFLEAILSDVKETCAPSLPNGEFDLCERLQDRFYHDAVPEPGKPVLAMRDMAFHVRLYAVEARLSATPATPTAQRGEDLVSY
jgi:hypothetical protein